MLDHAYDAKVASKVTQNSLRQIINSDFTTKYRNLDDDGNLVVSAENDLDKSKEKLNWMQTEFDKMDFFDPAQLNMIILQSGLSYQYLRELQSRREAKPETAISYIAEKSIFAQPQSTGCRNVPVFPFTADYLSPNDGFILYNESDRDSQEHHET